MVEPIVSSFQVVTGSSEGTYLFRGDIHSALIVGHLFLARSRAIGFQKKRYLDDLIQSCAESVWDHVLFFVRLESCCDVLVFFSVIILL